MLCFVGAFLAMLSVAALPYPPVAKKNRFSANESSAPTGQWAIVDSPSPSTLYNYLLQVACLSANNCWAVGSYWAGNHDQALIEHWDGSSWSVVSTPSPGPTSSSYLAAISCLSENDCWAVGSYSAASTGTIGFGNVPIGNQPLVEHWDGTAWSIVTSPPGPADTALRGVSCVAANDCWAVGHSGDLVIRTFIEHYDGIVWSIVPSPNQSSPTNALYAVTCASATDCSAVGQFFNTVPATCGDNQTVSTESLVEHWDGVTWTIVNAPYDPCRYNLLDKIFCRNHECWAVGTKGTDTSNNSTLIQHHDGAEWSIVESPNTDPVLLNYLYGVTCASPNDCWATGTHDIGGTNYRPMIQHYDGTLWSIVGSPIDDTLYRLDDITCVNSHDCWAVGIHNNGRTLIEHYTVPVSLNAVVSRKAHGNSGTFDIDLTNGSGIECRSGGASNNYQVVVTFGAPVTFSNAQVTQGTGSVSSTSTNNNQVFINLTGVTNAQTIQITLIAVNDGTSTANVTIPMSILIGDTNADRFTDAIDVSQTKSQSGNAITNSNFREDVNVDGFIDAIDVSLTKSKSGTALP